MAWSTNLITRPIFLFLMVLCVDSEKVMRPKFKDVKIWSDNVFLSHSITFNAADPYLNLSMTALQDLHNIDFHSELNVVHKNDPSYFFAWNSTLNICNILNWRSQSPIGSLIHSYLKEYGNIFENCPIAKGQYFMNKFWIPEDSTSALLPEVDFDLRLSAFHVDSSKKRTLIADDHITGECVVQDVKNIKHGILAMLPKAG